MPERTSSLRLSMFQCMVVIDNMDDDISLNTFKKDLEHDGHQVNAYFPGSLGRVIPPQEIDTHQIGSLAFKYTLRGANISILIFKNKKIKISGGFNKLPATMTNATFDDFFHAQYLSPILQMVFSKHDSVQWRLEKKMMNGNLYRKEPIGKRGFLQFIERLKHTFQEDQVILPEIMQANGKRRGRICAVKVKNLSQPGSFAVDHGGNVQFFAYATIEDLQTHAEQLIGVWL